MDKNMPIFEKANRRIMFAHIPKCAGVSIYSGFVASGWTIKNLQVRQTPNSAYSILKERFGTKSIEQYGRLFRYPHSSQHAPHLIWRTWGPFETSFTVVREPTARLLSALRFHHRRKHSRIPFQDFSNTILAKVQSKPWALFFLLDGHLIPQSFFVGAETEVFHFEDNWAMELSKRFAIDLHYQDNVAPKTAEFLSDEWQDIARRIYRKDFIQFNYQD